MSTLKIGSLVYATCQGLGYLAKSFYDHGIVTHPLVVEHTTHENHPEWYPGCPSIHIRDVRRTLAARDLCASVDAMLFFETPFDWNLVQLCKDACIPAILMPMYECTPKQLPVEPDYWFFPSLLDAQEFMPHEHWESARPFSPRTGAGLGVSRIGAFTPVPVEVPWRQRTKAELFVHNSGHGSFHDRNGTKAVLDAWPLVRSQARLWIRSQRQLNVKAWKSAAGFSLDVTSRTVPFESLWDDGDAFIFPERFNGLSLPLQEARAAGMLVMGSDRFPMNQWLPNPRSSEAEFRDMNDPGEAIVDVGFLSLGRNDAPPSPLLIPVKSTARNRIGNGYREFDEAVIDPQDIANCIDAWYGRDITTYSQEGRLWASEMSWEKLGPAYTKLLQEIVEG